MLDSVLMPSGLRDYEPKTYMNEIDKRAGRVFSKAVELPVQRGRNKVQSRPQRHDCHWGNPQKLREHFQRLDSILMSSREEKPHWWCKEYEDGKAARPEWKELMNPMTMDELVEAVKSTENGKAPGPDRLSVDMIKCLFWGRRESEATPLNIMRTAQSGCKWTWEDNPAPNAAMKVMLLLCNASIGLAEVTPGMQRGEILFIPKQTEAGTATIDVEDMRPITLLPELGKLTNRVLARRVTMTLMRHPELLDPAQRGFLKDGSTGQCVNVVLDVFEDHHERKGKKSLFTVSYDLKKAYDCVQEYSLRAALTRAGTPREFVEYVCSSLKAAKSRVRTKHGLTKGFDIKTSVRQGDPLAPLLFILLADMLHKGLRANPLYGNCNDGYRFSNQHDLVVSSVGFADDFITFSQTREGIDRMHDWVREFCGAHEMEINANKTVFVATGCAADQIPLLVNVAGNELIEPHDGNYVFRYLGVWLRVRRGNDAWTKQIAVTNACVNGIRGKIVSNRLDIIMATHVVNTVLIPQVEMAGRFVPFTVEDTKQWNLKVIQSILKASGDSEAKHVSRVGFNLVTGLIRPREAIMMARIMDVASRLTAVKRLDSRTMWARIKANGGEQADHDGLLQAAFETDAERAANNRVLLSFHMMQDIGLRITANASPWWSQNVQTLNVNDHMQNWNFWNPYYSRYTLRKNRQTISVDAFTDGSTVPGGLAPSGVGIVLKDTVLDKRWWRWRRCAKLVETTTWLRRWRSWERFK